MYNSIINVCIVHSTAAVATLCDGGMLFAVANTLGRVYLYMYTVRLYRKHQALWSLHTHTHIETCTHRVSSARWN